MLGLGAMDVDPHRARRTGLGVAVLAAGRRRHMIDCLMVDTLRNRTPYVVWVGERYAKGNASVNSSAIAMSGTMNRPNHDRPLGRTLGTVEALTA
jgi:hypothetical protein